MSRKKTFGLYRQGCGYSLLEVMVAVVILSVGLAALGLLQVVNVQNTYNANNRAVAATAARDMADRIRANLVAYENGLFANASVGANNNCATGGGGTVCNFTAMAQDDLAQWQQQLGALLPAGAGVVCVDNGVIDDGNPGAPGCSGTGNTVIKVFWRETASFSDDLNADDVNNQWQSFGLVVYP